MSQQVTTAFVQQYKAGIDMLVQQGASRLSDTVQTEDIVGETAFFDQVGSVEAQQVQTRHGDSPLANTPHARRRVAMFDYEVGDIIDSFDKVKLLNDPTNAYTRAFAAAMGRAKDRVIINAFWGTAYIGKDGSTTVTSGWNTVAVNSWLYGTGTGNSGLTISKLIEGKVKLWGAEAIDSEFVGSEPIYMAVTSKQLGDLLQTTEATSADYNEVRALARGEINSFMGINFKRTELLTVGSANQRRCPMYVPSAMRLGIGMNVTAEVARRPDKRFSWYAYYAMSLGASRMQEQKITEVICLES